MQSPLHPVNTALPLGRCVSETSVFKANGALHAPVVAPSVMLQMMPAGVLVTVPAPRDAGDGATVSVLLPAGGIGGGSGDCAVRYVRSTVRWPSIVTLHGSPVQLALHA